jgi:hypothetical protein
MPIPQMSADTLLDTYGLYHMTQLQADPDLVGLVESFREAEDRLKTRNREYRTAAAANLVALAVRNRKDAALDEAVLGFNHAVLEYVKKDRRAPLYLKYFPEGLREVTATSAVTEVRKVTTILGLLAGETAESLKSHAAPLTTALQELEAAIAAQQKTIQAEDQAQAALKAEKNAWLDNYRQNHRKLELQFHDRPRRAEAYFRSAPKVARDDENGEPSDTTHPAAGQGDTTPAQQPDATIPPVAPTAVSGATTTQPSLISSPVTRPVTED